MSLLRNITGQHITFYAYNNTTWAPVTGDAANISAFVSIDGGAAVAAVNTVVEMSAANLPGYYRLALAQAETNGRSIIVGASSTTANVRLQPREFHTLQWLYDGVDFEDVLESVMAVLFGVAERTGTGTIFNKRDGTTDKVTVTHDSAGNRTVSTVTP